jgi:hypothetical protein
LDLHAWGVFPDRGLPASGGPGRQEHVSALTAAVAIRPPEAGKPQADLKTTNQCRFIHGDPEVVADLHFIQPFLSSRQIAGKQPLKGGAGYEKNRKALG